jgi:hypothetical protein
VFIPTTVLNGQVLFAIFAIGIMFPCRFHNFLFLFVAHQLHQKGVGIYATPVKHDHNTDGQNNTRKT